MQKVVIANCNNTWWLVQGVDHLQDMLCAREAADLVIDLVTCKAWADVLKLWLEPELGKLPWAINPKVIERLKARECTTVLE